MSECELQPSRPQMEDECPVSLAERRGRIAGLKEAVQIVRRQVVLRDGLRQILRDITARIRELEEGGT